MDHSPSPSPRSRRRPVRDGLNTLALAAGLALGHIVAAMAELGAAATATLPAALVFAAAAAASTLCVLANLASARGEPALRTRVGHWVIALGIGFVGALLPGLL